MRILIYGAGIIGSYLAHVLYSAGNEVTILARGERKQNLDYRGLVLHHVLQRKTTCDHPKIIDSIGDEKYDLVFAAVQFGQLQSIFDDLCKVNSSVVVLVGNNFGPTVTRQEILRFTEHPKTVLFAFPAFGGHREGSQIRTTHVGPGSMTIGLSGSRTPKLVRNMVERAFQGTKFELNWEENMDDWLKCHGVFMLPLGYLSYLYNCDLRNVSSADFRLAMDAIRSGYELLSACGHRLDSSYLEIEENGLKSEINTCLFHVAARSPFGRLMVTDHCATAAAEIKAMDDAFEKIRARKPEFKMPAWDELRNRMPSWQYLLETYR